MVFQSQVNSAIQALGNKGQIAKGFHSYCNISDFLAGETIKVGEFAQSTDYDSKVNATEGKALTGSILGVVVKDSLKNNEGIEARDFLNAGENLQIIDVGSVYIESEKAASVGQYVMLKNDDGEVVFNDSDTLADHTYTGWRVFISNSADARGIVGITTIEGGIAGGDIVEPKFRKVLENADKIITTDNSITFTGVNQGVVFPAKYKRIIFTLPDAGEQSVYFGIKASKDLPVNSNVCFFQALVFNSGSVTGSSDPNWNDWSVSNIYMRDGLKGVFDEAGTRDYDYPTAGGELKGDGKDFSEITGKGVGAKMEISLTPIDANRLRFTLNNLSTGSSKYYDFGGYQNFRNEILEMKFGFFTRSYDKDTDFEMKDLEYYRSLEFPVPVDESKIMPIEDIKKATGSGGIDNPYPAQFAKGNAAYTIRNIELYEN